MAQTEITQEYLNKYAKDAYFKRSMLELELIYKKANHKEMEAVYNMLFNYARHLEDKKQVRK